MHNTAQLLHSADFVSDVAALARSADETCRLARRLDRAVARHARDQLLANERALQSYSDKHTYHQVSEVVQALLAMRYFASTFRAMPCGFGAAMTELHVREESVGRDVDDVLLWSHAVPVHKHNVMLDHGQHWEHMHRLFTTERPEPALAAKVTRTTATRTRHATWQDFACAS